MQVTKFFLEPDYDVLTLDESPFSNENILPGKGWCVRGDPHNFGGISTSGIRFTLLLAISQRHGVIQYMFAEGGVNSGTYFYFLFYAIKTYREIEKRAKLLVFQDNCQIHLNKRVKTPKNTHI